jgi:hypothetical protein
MSHSAAMQKALDGVADVARIEALMFSGRHQNVTVFGLNLDQVRSLMDFYEESTGLSADQIGLHRTVIIYAPSIRSGVDALMAHGIDPKKYHPNRIRIIVPDLVHTAFGLSRETPWALVSDTPGSARFWTALRELKARFNNEPSDIRVACARAGII